MNNDLDSFKAWQEHQKSILRQFPFLFGNNGFEKNMQLAIKGFMKHAMAGQPGYSPFLNEDIDYELFDSQRVIIVRCKLPGQISERDIRFFANKTKLKIEHSGNTQEIMLPSEVYPAQTSARMDGDVVEILLPKVRETEPFQEIFIRE